MSRWFTIEAERVLYVHRGRDVILCDRDHSGPVTLVVRLSNQAIETALAEVAVGTKSNPGRGA